MKRLAAVFLMSIGFSLGFGMLASVASAQDCPIPDIADFTDPVTGVIDTDAYTAALACGDDIAAAPIAASGELARTGSNTGDLAAAGVVLIVVGGGVVLATRNRAKEQV